VEDPESRTPLAYAAAIQSPFQPIYYLHLAMGDDAPLEVQQTAILHDILEDTPVTVDDLIAAGFSRAVTNAVWVLTRDKNQTYADYIGSIIFSKNEMAISVKLADLADNLAPERRGGIKRSLIKRYEWAHAALLRAPR